MFFESHAHYDDERFNEDRHELLKSLQKDIDYIINVGADMNSSFASIKLAEEYNFIYAAVGVHPHEVKSMKDEDLLTLEKLSSHHKVVAIGEIGLDYYYDNSPRDTQRKRFIDQLELAYKVNKPVIIHSRDAAQECFDILKASKVRRGSIHCYSGSVDMALEYSKMGFFIGVGGVVTFNNAKKLVEVVRNLPIEKILIETDSPYLSPIPKRGSRNDSQNLLYISQKISDIKQIPLEIVTEITRKNSVELFSIK